MLLFYFSLKTPRRCGRRKVPTLAQFPAITRRVKGQSHFHQVRSEEKMILDILKFEILNLQITVLPLFPLFQRMSFLVITLEYLRMMLMLLPVLQLLMILAMIILTKNIDHSYNINPCM